MSRRLNLATQPFVSYRRFVLMAGALALLALTATLAVGAQGWTVWRESSDLRAQRSELESRRQELIAAQKDLELELQAPATREVLDRAQFFNQLIEHKRLSWIRLFGELQERLPAQARILSLAPRLRDDGRLQVELRVAGESASAVIGFLQALEEGDAFREVTLRSQSRQATGGDELIADITAVYLREKP
jgi:Tfp pilus assembly protein PilN